MYIYGREMCNAYSELNDPIDQRERFKAQEAALAAGDDEANTTDEDFMNALEIGMPPTGGIGLRYRPSGHAVHQQPGYPRRITVPDNEVLRWCK